MSHFAHGVCTACKFTMTPTYHLDAPFTVDTDLPGGRVISRVPKHPRADQKIEKHRKRLKIPPSCGGGEPISDGHGWQLSYLRAVHTLWAPEHGILGRGMPKSVRLPRGSARERGLHVGVVSRPDGTWMPDAAKDRRRALAQVLEVSCR